MLCLSLSFSVSLCLSVPLSASSTGYPVAKFTPADYGCSNGGSPVLSTLFACHIVITSITFVD